MSPRRALLIWSTLFTTGIATAAPVGTTFTYQGLLDDNGEPANGSYDLQFSLWDASGAGSQAGSTICRDNVPVLDGLFTVQLDFGASVFAGDARWLQIGVRAGGAAGNCGSGPYTPLSPRQSVTAAPYAMGLRLPLSQTANSSTTALQIINAGAGRAAYFHNTSTNTGVSALRADIHSSNTGVSGVHGVNFGGGYGGAFEIDNPTNSSPALWAVTNGTGRAALFSSTNAASNATTVRVDTNSSNPNAAAIAGVNSGDGHAAIFQTGTDSMNVDGDAINCPSPGFLDSFKINNVAGSSLWLCGGGGNVGIGTGVAGLPVTKLHVDGGSDANVESITSGYVVIGATNGANIVMDNNEIIARNDGAVSTLFLNHNGGEVQVGQGSGGTGRLVAPVLQITGGSDFSENFDVAHGTSVEPGIVVCLDPQSPGKVRPCQSSYDRTVAGVISGAGGVRPGMLMGQSGSVADGAHPVALSGRVYVRCDARQHGIEVGDLLTTSDLPGHAMKAADADRSHGAVLGKAMTRLAKGEAGLVLVLVNLQ